MHNVNQTIIILRFIFLACLGFFYDRDIWVIYWTQIQIQTKSNQQILSLNFTYQIPRFSIFQHNPIHSQISSQKPSQSIIKHLLMNLSQQHHQTQPTSLSSIPLAQQRNMIQLKNQSLQPQILKISLLQPLIIRVSHNNSFMYSQIGSVNKKYIFAIEQLEEQSGPLGQGQEYEFGAGVFNRVGEFKIVCINMPKVEARIVVQKGSSQSADQLLDSIGSININQSQLFLKTPIQLPQVKQQQPQQQNIKQPKQQPVCLSTSKSDLDQYQRILTQQNKQYPDTIQNKYIKYFKEEFKLWRNFFQEQQLNQKKLSLKSKHTKNLSLSEVKEIDPKHKSQCQQSDKDSSQNNSSSMGENNSSSMGKGVASQLYSHQEILDRNNLDDIHSTRKQMKKTNSEYGFNIDHRSQEKQPTLDKISVFGKDQEINLPSMTLPHSRRSNHESSSNKKSRISISRTVTNSPALKDYKKENNFVTWVVEWAKEKEYKLISVGRKNDGHLIRQFDTYMKNKFKVSEFLYC